MYSNSYSKLLKDIAATKPLSQKEENTLFVLYSKTHDKMIRDKIVQANMRFVLKTALAYKNSSVEMSDIIIAGSTGLIKAVENYDVTRGLRFMTYALYWIKSYIHSAIEKHKNLIAIPWNQANAIKIAKSKCRGNIEIDPELRAIDTINKNMVAFDSPVSGDSKNTFADIIADHNKNVTVETDTEQLINALTACLPENEKHVLCETYGVNTDKPHSLREIGSEMCVSHSRIKQLRDQALRRIKKYTSPEMLQICKEQVAEM
jgi:RNA polymerase primary sigma factor